MNTFWDERYNTNEYIYGEQPNAFFKEQLAKLKPGKILLPAEGEGRNAVYAASRGWDVHAFDASQQGKIKADHLARKQGVNIQYNVYSIEELNASGEEYDAIGLVFVHLPPELRKPFHKKLMACLKPGGVIIMEVFSKEQIHQNSGGPPNINLLYDKGMVSNDFTGLTIQHLEETSTQLDEGKIHQGYAEVVRLVAVK